MNRITTFLLCFFLLMATGSRAQNAITKSKVIEKIDGTEYYIHPIQKGQTLYSIARAYGVEMEEIIRLNPEIREGLKVGGTLKIPAPVKPSEKPKKPRQVPADSAHQAVPAPARDLPCGMDASKKKAVYDVAFLMHFHADEMDSIRTDDPTLQAGAYRCLQFIQFYEGFLMAADSMKKEGLSIRLHVYDLEADTNSTKKFLKDPDLRKMDLIVALLYNNNFRIVADFGKRHAIPVVSPVSERPSQVEGNPFVFKVRPSLKTLYPQVAAVIARDFAGSRVILVRNNVSRNKEAAEQLKRELHTRNMEAITTEGPGMLDHLSKDFRNVVVIITENKTYALDLLTQLNGVKDQFEITLFGLPRWDRMEGMEYDFLSGLKTRIASPAFIDYENDLVKKFTRTYQETYKTDPDLLAFVGYDVAHYFLTALLKYGTAFPKCVPEMKMDLLQSVFEFKKEGENGYENSRWMIYYYENYRLFPVE